MKVTASTAADNKSKNNSHLQWNTLPHITSSHIQNTTLQNKSRAKYIDLIHVTVAETAAYEMILQCIPHQRKLEP